MVRLSKEPPHKCTMKCSVVEENEVDCIRLTDTQGCGIIVGQDRHPSSKFVYRSLGVQMPQ